MSNIGSLCSACCAACVAGAALLTMDSKALALCFEVNVAEARDCRQHPLWLRHIDATPCRTSAANCPETALWEALEATLAAPSGHSGAAQAGLPGVG